MKYIKTQYVSFDSVQLLVETFSFVFFQIFEHFTKKREEKFGGKN